METSRRSDWYRSSGVGHRAANRGSAGSAHQSNTNAARSGGCTAALGNRGGGCRPAQPLVAIARIQQPAAQHHLHRLGSEVQVRLSNTSAAACRGWCHSLGVCSTELSLSGTSHR